MAKKEMDNDTTAAPWSAHHDRFDNGNGIAYGALLVSCLLLVVWYGHSYGTGGGNIQVSK